MYDGYVIFDHTICKYGGLNMPVSLGYRRDTYQGVGCGGASTANDEW